MDGSIVFRGRVRGILPAQGQTLTPAAQETAAADMTATP